MATAYQRLQSIVAGSQAPANFDGWQLERLRNHATKDGETAAAAAFQAVIAAYVASGETDLNAWLAGESAETVVQAAVEAWAAGE